MTGNSYAHWLAIARRHSRVAEDAEDLLQEALLIAWRAQRNPLDSQDSVNGSWFHGVIRRQAAFRARSAVHGRQREQEFVFQQRDGQQDWQSTRQSFDTAPTGLAAWRDLAAGLPASQRRVLLLALHGLSRPEICRVLDISDAALRQRLHSLRQQLQLADADMTTIAMGYAELLTASNPQDSGLRRAVLNRGPQRLPGLRFGISDPDGHFLGISGSPASQNSAPKQQEDGYEPDHDGD